MLAVLRAVERFHIYLYGLDFTIITDCHALIFAINKAHLNPRIARWTLRLQNYKFKVLHRIGRKMMHVDALSRIVSAVEPVSLEKELQCRQLTDPKIQELAQLLENTEHDKYTLIEGLVYKKCKDKLRFFVPESMINSLLFTYHDKLAHCNADKSFESLRANYWFPSMRNRIRNHIENCTVCMTTNTSILREEICKLRIHPKFFFIWYMLIILVHS